MCGCFLGILEYNLDRETRRSKDSPTGIMKGESLKKGRPKAYIYSKLSYHQLVIETIKSDGVGGEVKG